MGVLQAVLRSLVFAGALVAVSVVVDLLLTVFTQAGRGERFFIFRVALHGATFVFSALGAAVGFAFLRRCSISGVRIAALGATLGVFSALVAQAAVQAGGYWALTAWLVATSALVSFFGAKVLGDPC
jgi:hypothetical protein